MLTHTSWLRRYETGLHDLVEGFYVPALSRAVQYDRKAGFFSSSALAVAATGIARLLANGGRMRLLVGVRLSDDDVEALHQGYRQREEVVAEALQRAWSLTEDEIARNRLGAMAEMVARELLEMRVVAPTDAEGNPLSETDAIGMFHEKSGIFTDADGNQLVFVGSINESETAWTGRNIEHFHVFCSWREDADHAGEQAEDFERLWEGRHPRALTLPFPNALREGLLELRPEQPPEYDPLEKNAVEAQAAALERERWLFQFLRDAPLLENGPALVEGFSALSPWPHQRVVWQRACADYPDRWHMLCDEVGLGKTIETGLMLRSLLLPGHARRVLLLVPKSLIKQWQQELREKFNLWAYWYTGKEFLDPLGERLPAPDNGWDADHSIIIASTALARRRGRMETLLQAREWDLVLVDEAHNARRNWAPGEKRRNRLLRLLDELRKRTRALQLMTATPMQLDVRELWDLLRLSGMEGRWAANLGEDFRQYFLALGREPWSREDLAFLVEMTHAYFSAGGEADPRLEAQFRRVPGGFTLWRQLTDPRRAADPARVEEAMQAHGLRGLMAEFFQRHTPVRTFMFRHTRDTLRRYRAQGLLRANVPVRDVKDRFIPLGPMQELYDRIEEYIGEKYRKAEAEKRRALGYVMTIYRQRLTSSPWAISETLRRRLERNLLQVEDETELDDEDDLPDGETPADWDEDAALDMDALAEEISYIEEFLRELKTHGIDPKLQRLLSDLQDLRVEHPQVVIFTQYTDTMDFLRDELAEVYGEQVACYSGRGGEAWDPGGQRWKLESKDDIKSGFAERRYGVLVCTEAASEGLNLQTSDLLINYDMPWNPMRVEQRIGRIDRIGQPAETVRVLNYYYEGSVEAQIYEVLRERLQVFRTAVGRLQPVLGGVARRIERAAMASREEKQATMERERRALIDDIATAEREGLNVDEVAEAGVALPTDDRLPCRQEDIRDLVLGSQVLAGKWEIAEQGEGVFRLEPRDGETSLPAAATAAFRQDILEARPEEVRHCMAWGDPVFHALLSAVPAPAANRWGKVERVRCDSAGTVCYVRHGDDRAAPIRDLRGLRRALEGQSFLEG